MPIAILMCTTGHKTVAVFWCSFYTFHFLLFVWITANQHAQWDHHPGPSGICHPLVISR